ncbi:unannotated protein [freshwater metagenome]|uniref:Unannotated protein n=1 Tax=freshwater metagenome TaxID=449393 RepID=A0A6J7GNF2_9ZZZZ|nr:hypothetical protein [Actinomycetota bacterium]MSW75999.1 hypothetical protein [Actinomycetota bacterium]
MKRALLIAGGTVGGLGAVLSITPPQISSGGNSGLSGLQSGAMTISGTGSSTSATHVAPVSATSASSPASTPSNTTAASVTTTTKKHKVTARKAQSTGTSAQVQTQTPSTAPTQSQTPAAAPTQSQTPAAAPTQSQTPAAAAVKSTPKGNSGKFVGTSVFVQYGYVQVELTVENGKITDARALQAPNGRSDRFSQYAIPVLRQQTLNAQSSKIQGASGASYTSWGWYTSLQAALVKAGM